MVGEYDAARDYGALISFLRSSIRAFRSLKLNEAYELELKAKQGKAQEKERLAKEKATQPKTSAPNPFSVGGRVRSLIA